MPHVISAFGGREEAECRDDKRVGLTKRGRAKLHDAHETVFEIEGECCPE